MPWKLESRDGEWLVVKDDGSVAGHHSSRADAIKHQRALYANESKVASMYAELDARPEPDPPAVTLKIDALTAAVMERIAERQALTDQALVSALEAIGTRDASVNVHPTITVEPTPVTVEAPTVNVAAPTVNVDAPTVNVETPSVTVQPADVVLPERSKTVTFERDPLTQQVTRAEVREENAWQSD